MKTVVLNKLFRVVDLRPGEPRADGRQFPISDAEHAKLRAAGNLNGADGMPRWVWDPESQTAREVQS